MTTQEQEMNNPDLDLEDNSSSDDRSSSTGGKSNETDNRKNEDKTVRFQFAKRESRNVFFLRLLVFVVLFLASLAVSIVVYYIADNSQSEAFVTQYEGAAKQVTDAFKAIIMKKLGAISAIGIAMTADSVDNHKTWPFVTLSSFQERASTVQSLSSGLLIGVGPYVTDEDRSKWEEYAAGNASNWVDEAFDYQKKLGLDKFLPPAEPAPNTTATSDPIFYTSTEGGVPTKITDPGPGPYMPYWQSTPMFTRTLVNQNILRSDSFSWGSNIAKDTSSIVVGRMDLAPPGTWDNYTNPGGAFYSILISTLQKQYVPYKGDPMSVIYLPVFDSFNDDRAPVAILFALFNWGLFFENVLPANVKGVAVILENPCDGAFTYNIDGASVAAVGKGDFHEAKFSHLQRVADWQDTKSIADGTAAGLPFNQDQCRYRVSVYPTAEMYSAYQTKMPIIITVVIAFIFVITAALFLVYDRLVEQRQQLVMRKAAQSTAIVSSLFPENVRERLLQNTDGTDAGNFMAPNHRLKSYLKGDCNDAEMGLSPIADLFPHATVFFGDIAGFTAWSSTRDPAQVFILLQTVYQAFDVLATKRKVFKVETIGDSYVAVTGLPEPQENHAVIMARFAAECMSRMDEVTKELEVTLGPDTGELAMRMGMHSGPVTAGVLRGARSRFQLFGDTVNTAARMESTGQAGKIHISEATAALLKQAGKEHWVRSRKDAVEAKGKGVLHTFWLSPSTRKSLTNSSSIAEDDNDQKASAPLQNIAVDIAATVKQERLVNWIVELLGDHVKAIIAKRRVLGMREFDAGDLVYKPPAGHTSLDEFAHVVKLPKFDAQAAAEMRDYSQITLDPVVLSELKDYVSTIACAYRDNPFHNFEHACHVTMAVNKFLKRIVAPDIDLKQNDKGKYKGEFASQIHDYTHGINSDPLALFAIVFSALIHDADHRGVSNAQLIKEEEEMGALYGGKSVAEQNSLDLSWDLLMLDQFVELRRCIFATQSELRRFRQVIVNVVLATDIFDPELNERRKARWNQAFGGNNNDALANDNDLRATIVIEHIIQASDVSHTMQHWQIYRKWNQRLFNELYKAHANGRMAMNPAVFWYKGELGFFDSYVIPLANKLKDCNVFGVSSDECLNYALKNRTEWEQRGQEIVEDMVRELTTE